MHLDVLTSNYMKVLFQNRHNYKDSTVLYHFVVRLNLEKHPPQSRGQCRSFQSFILSRDQATKHISKDEICLARYTIFMPKTVEIV